MRRVIAEIYLIVGLAFAILSVVNFFSFALPNKVISSNILKIIPGMTMNQVFDILGKPYSISGLRGVHDMGCRNPNPGLNLDINEGSDIRKLVNDFISNQKFCCDGNKRDLEEFNFITLVYTRRGFLVSYPMLWVHLDQSYKVDNIFAKEYEGGPLGNDPGIYFFGFAMDSAYITRDYTKTYRWMNKEKFYRCFQ